MAILDDACEAKEKFKELSKRFNDLVSDVGLCNGPDGVAVEVRLTRELTPGERSALPIEIITKSNAFVPVKYRVVGQINFQ